MVPLIAGLGGGVAATLGISGMAAYNTGALSGLWNTSTNLIGSTSGIFSNLGVKGTFGALGANIASPFYNSGLSAAEAAEAPGYLYDPGYAAGFGANVAATAIGAPQALFGKALKASFYLQTLPRISNLLMGKTAGGPLAPFGLRGLAYGNANRFTGRLRGFFAGTMISGSPIGGLVSSGILSKHVFKRTSGTGLDSYLENLLKPKSFSSVYPKYGYSSLTEMAEIMKKQPLTENDIKAVRKEFRNNLKSFNKVFNISTDLAMDRYTKGIGNFIGIGPLPLNSIKFLYDLSRDRVFEGGGKQGRLINKLLKERSTYMSNLGKSLNVAANELDDIPLANNAGVLRAPRTVSSRTKKFIEESMNINDYIAKHKEGLIGRMAGVQLLNIMRYKYIVGGIMNTGGAVVNQALSTVNQVVQVARNIGKMEFGTGRSLDTQVASTERSRAISAMQNVGLSARSYLGQEAAILAG